MAISDELMMGGLTPSHELVFPSQPEDPEMRESMSVWLFEENGAFAFPRFGIEAEATSWDNRRVQGNFAFADGRILNGVCVGATHSPLGPEGRPTVLGAGPLSFRCVEPFRKWMTVFDGTAIDGTVEQQIAKTLDPDRRVPVRFEAELTMVTPAWVQDNSPDKVAQLSLEEAADAASMGIGWRFEHLFRAEGRFTVDGATRDFRGSGLRIKRQSVRPPGMAGFRGHCWQSAVFPDGRAFGYTAYPPREDGTTYNDAYVFEDGRMFPARATRIPWLRRIIGQGDDASFELEYERGTLAIGGVTTLSTFRIGNPDMGGIDLQQTGARYDWGGQIAYGMLERSSHQSLTTIG